MRSMGWHEPDESEKPFRRQLVEACDNVRRQIEVMETAPSYDAIGSGNPTSGRQTALRDLRAELEQLEEALANLGLDDA